MKRHQTFTTRRLGRRPGRRFAIPALLASALALPAPAQAAWESIRTAATATQVDRCDGDHKNGAHLLASENRPLRVATGARSTLEIFGHGIDFARSATLQGQPAGVSVTFQGGTGGAANAARRCGAIGSVKVLLDAAPVPAGRRVPAEQNFTMIIGDERIPITLRMPVDFRMAWDDGSSRSGQETLSPNRPALPTGSASPPPAQRPRTGSQACQNSQVNCVVVQPSPSSGPAQSPDAYKQRSLARCIIGKGGDARDLSGRLEIMLPDDRAGAAACFDRPSFTDTNQFMVGRVDIGVGRHDAAPGIVYAINGGRDVSVSTVTGDPETAQVMLDRNFAMTMIGSREFRLTGTNFAGRTTTLELMVQSVVPYGVASVSVAGGLAAPRSLTAGRFNPRQPGAAPAAPAPGISFDVQLAPSIAARRPMVWRVTTTGGQPLPASTACFAATSGTFSPAAGASRETITVPRTSASACTGQNFALRVGPDVVPERPLYVVSTPFTVR